MMYPYSRPGTPPPYMVPSCAQRGRHDWGGWVATERDGQFTVAMKRNCRRPGCGAVEHDTIPQEAAP